jgi:hypothetical protein
MLPSIPTDLLFIVRDYLLEYATDECRDDPIQKFICQDSERSWRNFLSVSNQLAWRNFRKETMIWSLNQVASRKYLLDLNFRKYIHESIIDSSKQVVCRVVKNTVSIPFLFDGIATSGMGSISIEQYSLREFPSFLDLRTLSIWNCFHLEELGSFPALRRLQLVNCPKVGTVGRMNNLRDLYLEYVPGELVSQFPLEQIENLTLGVDDGSLTILPRLKAIKELSLRVDPYLRQDDALSFSAAPNFVGLTKLHLEYFSTVNLLGLIGLKQLSLMGVPSNQIVGKEDIYPQLKSYSYLSGTDPGEELDYYYSLLKNVTDFTLHVNKNRSQFVLPEENKIKSLDISMITIPFNAAQENRFYWNLRLASCDIQGYSMFSNVQKLDLIEPTGNIDITPLRNVPYLHLEGLPILTDLSCFGNQRYLNICGCTGLSNEAVRNFGNVFHLSIRNCIGITEIIGLTNNSKVNIDSCHLLKKLDLRGKDYISVSVLKCNDLNDFRVSGRIYYLEFLRNTPWEKSLFDFNYEYLNGEKTKLTRENNRNNVLQSSKYTCFSFFS